MVKLRKLRGIKVYFGEEVPPEVLTTIRLLSKKWAIPIMYHLYRQNLGFSELKREVGKRVSSTMLSRALDELQESNLVEKRIVSTSPIRVEYSLRPIGSDFCALVESLGIFGKKYLQNGPPKQK